MKRTLLNLMVDIATALVMFGMVLTGYIIRFPLPPGTNKEWMLWGLTRHQWGGIHFWISTVLLAVILVHVCLHWNWIVTVVRQEIGISKPSHHGVYPDAVVVVLAVGCIFGGFAWIAHLGVERVPESHTDVCFDVSREPQVQKHKDSQVETASTTEPKVTWSEVYPILANACLSCHGPEKQRASIRFDQVENLLGNDGKKAWIIPGKSEESPLIDIVSGRRDVAMPSRHRLPETDVSRLRQWIDSGAALSASEKEVSRQKDESR